MNTNRADMAKREIQELLKRYPNYEGAKDLLRDIEEVLSQERGE